MQGLVARLSHRASFESSDVETADRLYAKYPESSMQTLVQGVLWAAANTSLTRRRTAEAVTFLRRLIVLDPKGRARELLVEAFLDASDWPSAETAAREGLALDPRNATLLGDLGYALLRQDRNSEAEEQLRASLEIRDDPRFRHYLSSLQKQMRMESGMRDQHIAHFDVRYDGEAHEDVGREILGALQRDYATLKGLLDHDLATTVPVILLSREQYYHEEGMSAGILGHFDWDEGRIRVPIRGLTPSLVSELEVTLMHELTHAFVSDLGHDVVPRHINEGLANFMAGRRFSTSFPGWGPLLAGSATPEMVAIFAREGGRDWRFPDTPLLTYALGLSLVEYLEESGGQGNVNTLLKAAGETRSIDQAFQRAYGRSSAEIHSAWAQRVRQQYGS